MESIICRVGAQVGMQTLMAALGEHPLGFGNKFTLKMEDGTWAWVQNISQEDFSEICKRKRIYSVYVLYLVDTDKCLVVDDRIPLDWYRNIRPKNVENSNLSDEYVVYNVRRETFPNSERRIHYCPYLPAVMVGHDGSSVYQLELNLDGENDEKS